MSRSDRERAEGFQRSEIAAVAALSAVELPA